MPAAVLATVLLLTGCGSAPTPGEAVPALRTRLTQVDSALAEGRYGVARSALDALVRETVTARDTGRLPAAQADRILGAAARLSADLPAAAPVRTPAATPTPTPTPTPARTSAPAATPPAPPAGGGGTNDTPGPTGKAGKPDPADKGKDSKPKSKPKPKPKPKGKDG
jgi:hypothetical protein